MTPPHQPLRPSAAGAGAGRGSVHAMLLPRPTRPARRLQEPLAPPHRINRATEIAAPRMASSPRDGSQASSGRVRTEARGRLRRSMRLKSSKSRSTTPGFFSMMHAPRSTTFLHTRPNPLDALAAGAQARKHVIERTVNEGRHGMSSSTARTAHSSRCASPAYPERVSATARAHESGRSRRGGHFCKNNPFRGS